MEDQDLHTINFANLYPSVMETWGVTGETDKGPNPTSEMLDSGVRKWIPNEGTIQSVKNTDLLEQREDSTPAAANFYSSLMDLEEPAQSKINIAIIKELTGNDVLYSRPLLNEQRELTKRDAKYVATFNKFLENQKFVPFVESDVAEEVEDDSIPSATEGIENEVEDVMPPLVLCDGSSPAHLDHDTKLEFLSRVGVTTYSSEKDLLAGIGDIVSKMNPDIIPGYHTRPHVEELSQPDIIETDEPYVEDEDDAPNEPPPADEKTQPVVIKLKKGFSDAQIKSFISGVDTLLKNKTPETLQIVTEDWTSENEHRPFPCIPGAKKLFARFAEAGLLACLVIRGCHRAAAELYCIAYCKAKVAKNGDVSFNAFHAKALASSAKFSEISHCKANVRRDGSKIYVST